MEHGRMTRRRLLVGVGGLGLSAVAAPLAAMAAGAAKAGLGPREAFRRLKEGNERFVLGRPRASGDVVRLAESPGRRAAAVRDDRGLQRFTGAAGAGVRPGSGTALRRACGGQPGRCGRDRELE